MIGDISFLEAANTFLSLLFLVLLKVLDVLSRCGPGVFVAVLQRDASVFDGLFASLEEQIRFRGGVLNVSIRSADGVNLCDTENDHCLELGFDDDSRVPATFGQLGEVEVLILCLSFCTCELRTALEERDRKSDAMGYFEVLKDQV